jgi:hypothetical protein
LHACERRNQFTAEAEIVADEVVVTIADGGLGIPAGAGDGDA